MPAIPAAAAGQDVLAPTAGSRPGAAQQPQQTSAPTRVDTCEELPKIRRALPEGEADKPLACLRSATEAEQKEMLKGRSDQKAQRPQLKKRVPVPNWCYDHVNGGWWAERFRACQVRTMVLDIYVADSGKPVGQIRYFEEGYVYSDAQNSTWGSQLGIDKYDGWGLTGGVLVAGDAGCPGGCQAHGKLASQFVTDKGIATGEWLVDSAVKDATKPMVVKEINKMKYHFFSPNWAKPSGWARVASEPARCDNVMKRVKPGCVFPKHTPTMHSMKKLPSIADNIRRVQKEGPHHYGLKKADGNPLTRTTNAKVREVNRKIACPKSRPRPEGKSCDEYPFASTNQGASKTESPDWQWAWVPKEENDKQGELIALFYEEQRILNGNKFWVEV
ncbi:NucA/NucB deoxyribonuclease domain-containing protein [Streptomyces sp. B15]|uniref:NucA/NucB deoxyribonuclease domain-containing protein n=1 Tax=Streptomyces sp. B15 TaxID=1537797 RepID=UPI001B35D25F|nr:NucA/NucB deoxyribonuclease domain-containing protein [Streptomyces sp. B15]MBQ1124282.1 hypothetical protein [Streptomyces sp. B15]